MKQITEYFSLNEKISLISEYLLGKNKHVVADIDYYCICHPIRSTYLEFYRLYKKDEVFNGHMGGTVYFLKLETVQPYINEKKDCLIVYKIPEGYKDINAAKKAYRNGEFSTADLEVIYPSERT